MTSNHKEMADWYRRAQEEILDSMDEELEMELGGRILAAHLVIGTSVSTKSYPCAPFALTF